MRNKEAWTDADEKRFINGLGTHCPEIPRQQRGLLINYRDALSARQTCGFDKRKAIAEIDKILFGIIQYGN